jgi:uncharacterized C2H2 Zn-finger protein
MYKKIKRKDINKYYKCPWCYKIVRLDNRYHQKKCKSATALLIEEMEKGAKTNDTEH